MHYVYAGFEEALNRRSLELHQQIFIVKFGYCKELASWEDRFNDGFKNETTGQKETLSLALCKGWRRIATVETGTWHRGSPGLETPLKRWAQDQFGEVALLPTLEREVVKAHEKWMPGTKVKKNGLGELRHVPIGAVPNLVTLLRTGGINDLLADEIVNQLGLFLESELALFASTLNLK